MICFPWFPWTHAAITTKNGPAAEESLLRASRFSSRLWVAAIPLLIFRLRLNLGAVRRQDEWRAGCMCDLARHAYSLALVGSNDLLWAPRLRSECHEVEDGIWFWLIEIEVYRFSAAGESVLGNLGVYNLSAYGCRLADVVLGVGGGYARGRRARSALSILREPKGRSQKASTISIFIIFVMFSNPVVWFGPKASRFRKSALSGQSSRPTSKLKYRSPSIPLLVRPARSSSLPNPKP